MLTLSNTDRSWPIPTRPWVMKMHWHDLLFMHHRVDAEQLRKHIPEQLEIDTFDGSAWIGVVPFRMTGVAPRLVPPMPWLSNFPELNVRTYVTLNGKPGVWFFSLDATNPLAVRFARRTFNLKYMDAEIEFRRKDCSCDGTWIGYKSIRKHRDEPPAVLDCEYRPIGTPFRAAEGSLEHFLTARYCLYCCNNRGVIYRGEIDHEPWQIQNAQAIINENTMFNGLDLILDGNSPVLHYANHVAARAWTIQPA
jgi:uncharacterized protein YqjF (DUF2071 family)